MIFSVVIPALAISFFLGGIILVICGYMFNDEKCFDIAESLMAAACFLGLILLVVNKVFGA